MIKEIHFVNWKSFRHAVLPIDPLTVLIGTNASGKTNAVEGLDFLRWAALPNELDSGFRAQSGDIRGEIRSAARKPETCFTLEALVQGKYSENTDYLYSITVNTASDNPLHSEKLTQIRYHPQTKAAPERIDLYKTDEPKADSQFISVTIYDKRGGVKQKYRRRMSILTQMGLSAIEEYEALRNRPSSLPEGSLKYEEEELYQVEAEELIVPTTEISEALQNIFILRPNPDSMRRYSRLARYLASNASNIAGVLATLPELRKKEVEDTLSKYLGQLPEGDLRRVWAEPVGRLNKDAMLYCEEEWIPGQPTLIDARDMSDGTLRFIAILTALLTRPEGSQLIIEEVDAGLHSSRAHLLLNVLQEIGSQRRIDVLVTTHNPALLDAMGLKMIPFVVVAHRNRKSGESKLTLLEDVENLPKLMASGLLGKVVSQGRIEESLSKNSETDS